MQPTGPRLDVNLAALVRNAARYAGLVRVPLLPMVKANGYGLGAVPVARALEAVDPFGFGVASPVEALELRAAGITRPIVIFQPLLATGVDAALAAGARPVIASIEALDAWTARTADPYHVEIDTGMGRSGFAWHDAPGIAALAARLRGASGCEGLFTHFSTAEDATTTETEWTRFQQVAAALEVRPRFVHAANSAAGQWSRYAADLARPGIFLYGGRAGSLVPEPVAALRGTVHLVRPIRAGDPVSYGGTWRAPADGEVATVAVGYADGLPRSLGNVGQVLVGGRIRTIVGRVTMDMTMVFAEPGAIRAGETATFFGPEPDLDGQAARAGTISYELLTSVGRRVTRHYSEHP